MSESIYYSPGVCNINPAEAKSRRTAGYTGVVIGVIGIVVLFILRANPYFGLLMFLPGYLAALGFLQAKEKFCVGFAAGGVYSRSEAVGDTLAVANDAQRRKDALKAKRIQLRSVIIGAHTAAASWTILTILQIAR